MSNTMLADLMSVELSGLRRWLETNIPTQPEAIKWATRWHTTVGGLKAFMRGERYLSAGSLILITKDTGIPLDKLVQHVDVGRAGSQIKVRAMTEERDNLLIEALIYPVGVPYYKEEDFDETGIWLRAVPPVAEAGRKSFVVPPAHVMRIPTGLKINESNKFVMSVTGRDYLYAALQKKMAGLWVVCRSKTGRSETIRAGSRMARLELARKASLSVLAYEVPKGYEWQANRSVRGW